MIQNRPTTDPNYYDSMFNNQARPEDKFSRGAAGTAGNGNQNVFEYHLFAPKFQNLEPVNPGWGDREQQIQPTKRDQTNIFPTRAPERRPGPVQTSTASHPIQNRYIERSGYQSANERIESFNRSVDSMHVPEDMQRAIPTRDMARSALDTANANGTASHQDTRQDMLSERQFSLESLSGGLPLSGGGNFEDMFY
jgi:hypothetical protein